MMGIADSMESAVKFELGTSTREGERGCLKELRGKEQVYGSMRKKYKTCPTSINTCRSTDRQKREAEVSLEAMNRKRRKKKKWLAHKKRQPQQRKRSRTGRVGQAERLKAKEIRDKIQIKEEPYKQEAAYKNKWS